MAAVLVATWHSTVENGRDIKHFTKIAFGGSAPLRTKGRKMPKPKHN